MALVKPADMDTSTKRYTGILPVALWDFKDRSEEFDWSDIFLSVELSMKDSDFTRFLEIAGKVDKDHDGNITGGFILKRLYVFFDLIGFKGGLTKQGTWEDGNGKVITKIGSHLNERFQTGNPIMDPSYDYLAYVYKDVPRKAGQKSYSRVHHRMAKNDAKGMADLQDHIKWMKGKGHIKEWTEPPSSTENGTIKEPALAGQNL